MDVADLLVIAGLPIDSEASARELYPATLEIGQLVAAASFLAPPQVKLLVQSARALRDSTQGEHGDASGDETATTEYPPRSESGAL